MPINERVILVFEARGTRNVSRNINDIKKSADSTRRTLAFLRSALVVLASASVIAGFADLADSYTLMRNRIRPLTQDIKTLDAVQQSLFKVSQDTGTSLATNSDLFVKLTKSTKSLGLEYNQLLDITKGIAQTVALSGASAKTASSSLVQFAQGLSSGVLRGDELRSVVEGLPSLAEVIGKEFGVGGGELIAFAKANDGILKTERVIKAVQSALPELGAEFATTTDTIGRGLERVNNALSFFIGGMGDAVGIIPFISGLLTTMAENIDKVILGLIALTGVIVFNLLIAQLAKLSTTILGLGGVALRVFGTFGRAAGSVLIPFRIIAAVVSATGSVIGVFAGISRATGTVLQGVLAPAFGAVEFASKSVLVAVRKVTAFIAVQTVSAATNAARSMLLWATSMATHVYRALALNIATMRLYIAAINIKSAVVAANIALQRGLATAITFAATAGLRMLNPLRLMTLAFNLLKLSILTNPLFIGAVAILALVAGGLYLVYKAVDSVVERFGGWKKVVDVVLANIIGFTKTLFNNFTLFKEAFLEIFYDIKNRIIKIFSDLQNFAAKVANYFLEAVGREPIEIQDPKVNVNAYEGAGKKLAQALLTAANNELVDDMGNDKSPLAALGQQIDSVVSRGKDLIDTFTGKSVDAAGLKKLLDGLKPKGAGEGGAFNDEKGLTAKQLERLERKYRDLESRISPLIRLTNELEEATKIVNDAVAAGIKPRIDTAELLRRVRRDIIGIGNEEVERTENLKLYGIELEKQNITQAEFNRLRRELFDIADPVAEYSERFRELREALDSKAIPSQTKFNDEVRALLGIPRPTKNLEDGIALLQAGMADTAMSQEEFNRHVRDLAGIDDPFAEYADSIAKYKIALDATAISQEKFERLSADARIELLNNQTDVASGVERALLKMQEKSLDFATVAEDAITGAFSASSDAIREFVKTGKFEIGDLFGSITDYLLQLALQDIGGSLGGILGLGQKAAGAAGGNGGGIFQKIFSDFLPGLFNAANGASLMIGGNQGVDNNTLSINAQPVARVSQGERIDIVPRGQSSNGSVSINMNISTPDADSFRRSQTQITAAALKQAQRALSRNENR